MKSQNRTGKDVKYSGKNWKIYDISIFGGSQARVLKRISQWLMSESGPKWIATVNTEFVMAAEKDEDFKRILGKTSLNVADGIGLIWAKEFLKLESYKVYKVRSKILRFLLRLAWGFKVGIEILRGEHRENLVSGADLMDKMCELAEKMGKSVYFLGGWGNRSERTAAYFLAKHPKLKVAGFKEENFDFKTRADILLVTFGMRRQEEWIANHIDKLRVKVVMGVGRSFDYYSGDLKRAPKQWRKMGLEWLYSLYQEPKRWRRQIALPKFVWKVLITGFTSKD